jgi:hypothetical protein
MATMPANESLLQEARARLLAETAIYVQLENLSEASIQCVREYQSILISLDAQRASRAIAQAWIDLGLLAVSLVLTAGGAVYAQGVLRGQGVYARFGMSYAERCIAQRATF